MQAVVGAGDSAGRRARRRRAEIKKAASDIEFCAHHQQRPIVPHQVTGSGELVCLVVKDWGRGCGEFIRNGWRGKLLDCGDNSQQRMGGAASFLELEDDEALLQCLLFSQGDNGEVEVVEVTGFDDDEGCGKGEELTTTGTLCVITVDCVNGGVTPASLAVLSTRLSRASTVGLLLSSKNLTADAFNALPPLTLLTYLHAGGNNALPLQSITSSFGSAQNRVLDLSYTESLPEALRSVPSSFAACPQLVRLVLDGCGLESSAGLFTKLSALRELSLKENLFESVDSLRGLECLASSLESLCLADNPVMEVSTQAAEIRALLVQMPRFVLLDDKHVREAQPTQGHKVVLSRAHASPSSAIGGMDGSGLDQMEQEYLSALKGEKDTSVVS